MPLNLHSFRGRAMIALQALVGTPMAETNVGLLCAIDLPDAGLLVIAGDHRVALDPGLLRPLAMQRGCSVLATWADPFLSGHRILIDAVLYSAGAATTFAEYRLWLGEDDAAFLVPEAGVGAALAITATGLRLLDRPPFASSIARTTGIARGHAWLHARLYAGTPFETPVLGSTGR